MACAEQVGVSTGTPGWMETPGLLCKGCTLGGNQLREMWIRMLDHTKHTWEGCCSEFLYSAPHSFSSLHFLSPSHFLLLRLVITAAPQLLPSHDEDL